MATHDTFVFPAGAIQREIAYKRTAAGKKDLPLLRVEAMALLVDVLSAVDEIPGDGNEKIVLHSALLMPSSTPQGTGYAFSLEFRDFDMGQVKSKISRIKDEHRSILQDMDHNDDMFKTKSQGNIITFVTFPPDDAHYIPDFHGAPMMIDGEPVSIYGGGGTLPTDLAFMWPVIGHDGMPTGTKTSRFGARGGAHKGLDIAAAQGTPIVAAHSGRVTVSDYVGAYGNVIYIDHGNMGGRHTTTRYAHNVENKVAQNETVRQGQLIALVGTTGRSTGPHLHFEIRIDGKAVDPEPVIDREATAAALQAAETRHARHHGPQQEGYHTGPAEMLGMSASDILHNLDLTTSSGLSGAQLNQILRHEMQGLGPAFEAAERKHGVNALFLASLAAHESEWGQSPIARDTNNLFGWGAYTHDPRQAHEFNSKEHSIDHVAGRIKALYLTPGGDYYHGPTLAGMNIRYAYDDEWGIKTARHMQSMINTIG